MEVTAGRWTARIVPVDDADGALALRARRFRDGRCDRDAHDVCAKHLLIAEGGTLVASARVALHRSPGAMLKGYTAARYDIAAFAAAFPTALEVGRICFAEDVIPVEVPRLMLAVLAHIVARDGIDALYGCSSFPLDGSGMSRLTDRVAPQVWRPRPKAAETVPLPDQPGNLPPLLRAWLSMGAGVSDHAVVDRDLNTLHVFTGLPTVLIPPSRARLLLAMLRDPEGRAIDDGGRAG